MKGKAGAARMSQMKSLGVVSGTTDLLFYFKGKLHAWDIKVGKDKLSDAQNHFILKVTQQGGEGCEIRSFDEFKEKFKKIINNE